MNQQAHYPAHVYQESYYPSPSPRMDQELRPDDSLSVVGLGGPAMPAPTLFSLGAQPQRR
ncbi:hypothetical protein GQ44DRAFT_702883 [Phaeosphaeriaceae sp. PMI808]|nr:hypothetical protein GQ44DRAFT_702883 [Phaeosphaeriaceae sp. PMI808]